LYQSQGRHVEAERLFKRALAIKSNVNVACLSSINGRLLWLGWEKRQAPDKNTHNQKKSTPPSTYAKFHSVRKNCFGVQDLSSLCAQLLRQLRQGPNPSSALKTEPKNAASTRRARVITSQVPSISGCVLRRTISAPGYWVSGQHA